MSWKLPGAPRRCRCSGMRPQLNAPIEDDRHRLMILLQMLAAAGGVDVDDDNAGAVSIAKG